MLGCTKVSKQFGGLRALDSVDVTVKKNDILGLIGPNGSGKTTLFNIISGIFPPSEGTVKFKNIDITHQKPHVICKLGIGRTFQLIRPFHGMRVVESVMVGALYGKGNLSRSEGEKSALEALEFVGLKEKKDVEVRNLTYVDQKSVELARALAVEPELLLLDEMIAGLDQMEIKEIMEKIRRIREEKKITIFLIEHVMKAVMELSDRIVVLSSGKKIAEGTPKEVCKEKVVIEAYLGRRCLK